MGAPRQALTPAPPPQVDTTAELLRGLSFANTQKQLRKGRGRTAAFLTLDSPQQGFSKSELARRNAFLGQ